MPKTTWKNGPLEDAIIANEQLRGTASYKTVGMIAHQYGCTHATVYTYRYRLVKQGRLPKPPPHARSTESRLALNEVDLTPKGFVKDLDAEPLIPAIERMKVLSRIIRTASPAMKIAAVKALEDMTRAKEGRVGPPAPLTEEDRVARLSRLMMACGQTTVDAAYAVAFKDESSQPEVPRPEVPLQPDTGAVPPAPPPSSLPLSDLSPDAPPPG